MPRSSGGSGGGGSGGSGGNAEGLLKGVDELSQLQHGESLDFFDHSGNFFASHL